MDPSRQLSSSSSSSMSITNDICNDILVEILSWLPVDSLLRFKSVCKSWFSLITNPKFVKLHLHHHQYSLTTATAQIHNPTILIVSKERYTLMSMDKVVPLSSSTVLEKLEMVYPFDTTEYLFHILGSCNGLICISAYAKVDRSDRIVRLWNPSTKEFKLLPSLDASLEFPSYNGIDGHKIVKYGFGYDHVMEDYKVIVSVQFFDICGESDHQELRVYTLGTDSWRRINQRTPYKREYHYSRNRTWSHVNGALHRIAQLSSSLSSDIRILSFDIVQEVYREVPKPKSFDDRNEWELEVLGGCLCLCVHKWLSTKQCYMMEVWMMMNYGVKESWTKLFNIPNGVELGNLWMMMSYGVKPVWFCSSGKLLVKVDNSKESKLAIYDPRHTTLRKFLSDVSFKTEIYIPSLVSLKSHKEIEKELIC